MQYAIGKICLSQREHFVPAYCILHTEGTGKIRGGRELPVALDGKAREQLAGKFAFGKSVGSVAVVFQNIN